MKAKQKLPIFKTDEEEAEYWSSHSTDEIWDQLEEVNPSEVQIDSQYVRLVEKKAKNKQLISIRLESLQIALAKQIALSRTLPYQTLIRQWIQEGIEREADKIRFSSIEPKFAQQVTISIGENFPEIQLNSLEYVQLFERTNGHQSADQVFARPSLS